MRILIVGMAHSVHVASLIDHIADQDWDIHVYPSIDSGVVHPKMRNVTVHHSVYTAPLNGKNIQREGRYLALLPFFELAMQFTARVIRFIIKRFWTNFHRNRLSQLIQDIQPDIVHSIELQHGAYLTLSARQQLQKDNSPFPTWIVTNWGSDMYYFRQFREHRERLREILENCDFYDCECDRDVQIAKELGLLGRAWETFPNAGGFDIQHLQSLQDSTAPSERKLILLKGYEGAFGRSLIALDAIRQCADLIREKGMQVQVYSARPHIVVKKINQLANEEDVPIVALPSLSHDDMLRKHGQARLSIGNSVSDGVSTSALESMAMGSFPIQSYTACVDEWFDDGVTGILTQPEDVDDIVQAIRRALMDDELVDSAGKINQETIKNRANRADLQHTVLDLYRTAKDL
jgi:glycosyltransferase involved in cell wall biosynthesis